MNPPNEPDLFPEPTPAGLSADPAEFAALQRSVSELRVTLHYGLGLVILLALAVNVYLYYQSGSMRAQQYLLQQNVEELSKVVSDYESNSLPWFERFSFDLHRIATRDPEVAKIVAKYQLPAPTNVPPPAAAPVPPPAR